MPTGKAWSCRIFNCAFAFWDGSRKGRCVRGRCASVCLLDGLSLAQVAGAGTVLSGRPYAGAVIALDHVRALWLSRPSVLKMLPREAWPAMAAASLDETLLARCTGNRTLTRPMAPDIDATMSPSAQRLRRLLLQDKRPREGDPARPHDELGGSSAALQVPATSTLASAAVPPMTSEAVQESVWSNSAVRPLTYLQSQFDNSSSTTPPPQVSQPYYQRRAVNGVGRRPRVRQQPAPGRHQPAGAPVGVWDGHVPAMLALPSRAAALALRRSRLLQENGFQNHVPQALLSAAYARRTDGTGSLHGETGAVLMLAGNPAAGGPPPPLHTVNAGRPLPHSGGTAPAVHSHSGQRTTLAQMSSPVVRFVVLLKVNRAHRAEVSSELLAAALDAGAAEALPVDPSLLSLAARCTVVHDAAMARRAHIAASSRYTESVKRWASALRQMWMSADISAYARLHSSRASTDCQ